MTAPVECPLRFRVRTAVLAVAGLFMQTGTSISADITDVPRDGLVLWLDASNRDGRHNSDKPAEQLTIWTDISGLNNHLSQHDVKRRPVWVRSGIGGQPSVDFQGNALLHRDQFDGFSVGDQTLHIAIVFQAPSGGPDSQRLLDLNSRKTTTSVFEKRRGFWVGNHNARYIPRFAIHHGDQGEALSAVWDDQPHLLELVYNGEQLFEIHVDGRTEQRGMFNGTHFLGFLEQRTLTLGQSYRQEDSTETSFEGQIGEILIYRQPLTTLERVALGTHLSQKYSLAVNFESLPIYERDIQPIFAAHCFDCHGADTQEASLDLRTVSSMLHGGKAGPVIVRGHPEHSELFAMLDTGKMPPEEWPQLSSEQIKLIRRWIQADAPTEKTIATDRPVTRVTKEDRRHWAWQYPSEQDPPRVSRSSRVRNDLDNFTLAKLEARGHTFSGDATPEQLVRRIYFDLIGLPPSPSEIDEFLDDTEPGHWERLVDRLLQSKHYGERWGRYWLDVTGHVDVNGSDNDAAIIKPLPGKWRYRDYVIRSFNDDKPFDRFLIEQLAGDELFDWKNAKTFTQPMLDSLTATIFLLTANDDTDQNELNTPDVRHHVLQRVSENVASTLFAVTLQCAKCHDHKYEALSQLDYYRFESVFAPVFNVRHWVKSDSRIRPDVSDAEQKTIEHRNAEIDAELTTLKQRRDGILSPHRMQLLEVRSTVIPKSDRDAATTAILTDVAKRSDKQTQLVTKYQTQLTVADTEIAATLSRDEKQKLKRIDTRITELQSSRRSYDYIAIATETPALTATHVLRRGNYLRQGLEVDPELPEILVTDPEKHRLTIESPGNLSGRRLALAYSVTDPDSLAGQHVARVFVNRVWQQVFGRGIVETSDNLGISGSKPSHPELLDWLTLRFIKSGWRIKSLIRLMVLSTTYQQSSHGQSSTFDPKNRLLWRMNLRQLDSEQLRDAILTVSGRLDRQLGGPPIPLDPRPDGMVVLKTSALPADTTPWRRSVYILSRRNYHLTFMRVFDQPIVARNCAVRKPSAVVTQALALLHDEFMLEQSETLAQRVINEATSDSADDRVSTAWRIVLGRRPNEEEAAWCRELLERHIKRYKKLKQQPERWAIVQLCHMLINTSEFLYVQ
ncbi:MAG: PSD1 and planctomycete cytochrome C domain-containing protein [Fuerstiella sp.]|nr:PSD1 and planctomycete cytochrome C domain-containing protein [Fuerstiella sp.]